MSGKGTLIQVFDPAMCCSTGVCGPAIDPSLARFASDLDWLTQQGARVERFSLSQQPYAFAINTIVRTTLHEQGPECLPMVLVDGVIACQGKYPSRAMLAKLTGIELPSAFAQLTVLKDSGCC
jgi:hypothetical protein